MEGGNAILIERVSDSHMNVRRPATRGQSSSAHTLHCGVEGVGNIVRIEGTSLEEFCIDRLRNFWSIQVVHIPKIWCSVVSPQLLE